MPSFPLAGSRALFPGKRKKAVFTAEKFLLMKNRFLRRVPGRIRTAGLPLRRRTLYPAELRKHMGKVQIILAFSDLPLPG